MESGPCSPPSVKLSQIRRDCRLGSQLVLRGSWKTSCQSDGSTCFVAHRQLLTNGFSREKDGPISLSAASWTFFLKKCPYYLFSNAAESIFRKTRKVSLLHKLPRERLHQTFTSTFHFLNLSGERRLWLSCLLSSNGEPEMEWEASHVSYRLNNGFLGSQLLIQGQQKSS